MYLSLSRFFGRYLQFARCCASAANLVDALFRLLSIGRTVRSKLSTSSPCWISLNPQWLSACWALKRKLLNPTCLLRKLVSTRKPENSGRSKRMVAPISDIVELSEAFNRPSCTKLSTGRLSWVVRSFQPAGLSEAFPADFATSRRTWLQLSWLQLSQRIIWRIHG